MYLQCEKETAIKPSRTRKTCDKALLLPGTPFSPTRIRIHEVRNLQI